MSTVVFASDSHLGEELEKLQRIISERPGDPVNELMLRVMYEDDPVALSLLEALLSANAKITRMFHVTSDVIDVFKAHLAERERVEFVNAADFRAAADRRDAVHREDEAEIARLRSELGRAQTIAENQAVAALGHRKLIEELAIKTGQWKHPSLDRYEVGADAGVEEP